MQPVSLHLWAIASHSLIFCGRWYECLDQFERLYITVHVFYIRNSEIDWYWGQLQSWASYHLVSLAVCFLCCFKCVSLSPIFDAKLCWWKAKMAKNAFSSRIQPLKDRLLPTMHIFLNANCRKIPRISTQFSFPLDLSQKRERESDSEQTFKPTSWKEYWAEIDMFNNL